MLDITALLQQQINMMNPEYQQQLRIVDGVVSDMAIARKGRTYAVNDIIDSSDQKHIESCKICKVNSQLEEACPSAKRRIDMAKDLKF